MFDEEDLCNLSIIADPNHVDFFQQLQEAVDNLVEDQAKQYFKITLGLFRGDLERESKKALLSSLYKVLHKDEFLEIFIDHWFVSALPFSHEEMVDDVLSILYLLVTRAPEGLDDSTARGLASLVKLRPMKCLQLIGLYAESFSKVASPWYLVDVLFDKNKYFREEKLAAKYAQIFCYLCCSYQRYAAERGSDAMQMVFSLLKIGSYEDRCEIYNCLCNMCSVVSEFAIPMGTIKEHLTIKELQSHALNFLLVAPLNSSNANDDLLIKRLFRCSYTDSKAVLVLMRMAEDEEIAVTLTNDCSWMEKSLPTVIDTLRLFLVVFKHEELRFVIGEDPGFVILMNNVINSESQDVERRVELYQLVLKILRRIKPLTEELINELSSTQFITAFLKNEAAFNTRLSKHDAVLLLHTLGEVCYTKEFLLGCTMLRDWIYEEGNVWGEACTAAVTLCRYKKCTKLFKEMGLVEYFTGLRQKKKTKQIAADFLRAMNADLYQEDE